MTFSIHGLAVARGIAIGRAVLVASSRVDVAHYFIAPTQVEAEIDRVRRGRNAVVDEIHRLQVSIGLMGPKEAPQELTALHNLFFVLQKPARFRALLPPLMILGKSFWGYLLVGMELLAVQIHRLNWRRSTRKSDLCVSP